MECIISIMFVKFPCYNIFLSPESLQKEFIRKRYLSNTFPPCFNCFCTFAGVWNKIFFHWIEKQNHNNMHKQTLNKRKKEIAVIKDDDRCFRTEPSLTYMFWIVFNNYHRLLDNWGGSRKIHFITYRALRTR